MRLMVLTPYLPHGRIGHGGGTAVRDLVRHLAKNHEVLLVALLRPGEEELVQDVRDLGVAVATIPFADGRARGLSRTRMMAQRARSLVRSLRTGFPYYVEKYWTADMRRRVLQLVREFQPEAIQVEYLQMSLYVRDLNLDRKRPAAPTPRLILNTHELGSVPRMRRALKAGSGLTKWFFKHEAKRWIDLQVAASRWADRCLCVTPDDHQLLQEQGGQNLLTVPLGMDLESVVPVRQPKFPSQCLFLGSFNHRPNVLAAELLTDRIWPLVTQQRPELELILAGPGSDAFLENRPPVPGIRAMGFVDNLEGLFSQAQLFVAPLPEGGGIKIKILEAMARGIPVLTTPIGAEGIADPHDEVLFIAEADENFAEAILQVLDNPQKEERARKARRHMEAGFGWQGISQRLTEIYSATD